MTKQEIIRYLETTGWVVGTTRFFFRTIRESNFRINFSERKIYCHVLTKRCTWHKIGAAYFNGVYLPYENFPFDVLQGIGLTTFLGSQYLRHLFNKELK